MPTIIAHNDGTRVLIQSLQNSNIGLRQFLVLQHQPHPSLNNAWECSSEIQYLSGVLQGCPASGWLFDSALDPFLIAFNSKLRFEEKGIVRACADDLSFALSRLKHLLLLYPVYSDAERLAGLVLHLKKSMLVPLIRKDECCYDKIKKWVCKHIPAWSDLQICDAAKLLGFYVGPGCGKLNWIEPLQKVRDRVKEIKSATAPTYINAYDYNVRVCPILGYQAQLIPLDARHFLLERIALHTVFRAPWNSLRHQDFFSLAKYGGPKVRSFNIACASALYRTAAKTVTTWPTWVHQMAAAAKEHLPAIREIKGSD